MVTEGAVVARAAIFEIRSSRAGKKVWKSLQAFDTKSLRTAPRSQMLELNSAHDEAGDTLGGQVRKEL